MADNQKAGSQADAAQAGTTIQLGIRLQPTDNSDQPVFTNFTVVHGTPETVFVDFGFLEPNLVPALARQAQSGGKMPEAITGRLACRVALGRDAAVQLAQQLSRQLSAGAQKQGAASRRVAQEGSA